MSLNRRLACLERNARTHRSYEDREDIIRMRRLDERIKASVREDPELYQEYNNSLDAFLEALEGARVRSRTTGDDPEKDSEVLETIRAYEEIEARLLNENDDDKGGDSATE